MRPAKFFFALLFAGVFLITLMKILFFALIAAAVFGTVFFLGRAFRRFGAYRYGHSPHFFQDMHSWDQPFLQQGGSSFIQPLDPNWQTRPRSMPAGRRIEVL